MDENLIQQQRYHPESQMEYPGSPSPEKHLASLGLSANDLPGELSNEKIMAITPSQAEGLRMLNLAEQGKFDVLIPKIRSCLHAASANDREFSRLDRFVENANPKSEDSINAAFRLARDAWKLKSKADAEDNILPPGQLDYSKVAKGQNLQPQTRTFGNGQTVSGQLSY